MISKPYFNLNPNHLNNEFQFTDSLNRTIVPLPRPDFQEYFGNAINCQPEKFVRYQARQAAEQLLEFPNCLAYTCKTVDGILKAPRPWEPSENNPYAPYLWRTYRFGNESYDLVVYRRARRSLLRKIFCFGA